MLSVDICKVPQEIFLQVPEAFPTLENLDADAMWHAIYRLIAEKTFGECVFKQDARSLLDTNAQ